MDRDILLPLDPGQTRKGPYSRYLPLTSDVHLDGNTREIHHPSVVWLNKLKVVDIKGKPSHSDEYGALREGATLVLTGARIFTLGLVHRHSSVVCFNFYGKYSKPVGSFELDDPAVFSAMGTFVCLGISISATGEAIQGLVLEKHVHDGDVAYRQVAYVDELDPSF